jgi:hypothetical protein
MKRFTALAICLVLTGCGVSTEDVAIDREIAASKARIEKCDAMRTKAKEMKDYTSNLVKEARALQLVWIKEEMGKLKDSGKISSDDWNLFSEYVKPGLTPPKIPGGELDLLMKRVVAKGYIRPYLPKDVVALGTEASLSPSVAEYQIGFPECFGEIELSGLKMLADLGPVKGIWGDRVENPADLIP